MSMAGLAPGLLSSQLGGSVDRRDSLIPPAASQSPRDVVRPATPELLAAALVEASEEGLAVTPQGGGVLMGLGHPPDRPFKVVETRALNRVLEYSPDDMTATVEAGLTLAEFQQKLAAHGQQVGLESPFPHRATIGGILSTAVAGPHRMAFGLPRDQVIGIRVAHPDGLLTKAGGRVVKNVTGYDMAKLYVGSLGTLAVIVEATFKLGPLPPMSRTIFIGCGSLDEGLGLSQRIMEARLQVSACELLDAVTQARTPGADAVGRRRWLLAVEFSGNAAAVGRQTGEMAALAREANGTMAEASGTGAQSFWDAVRDKGRVFGEPALILRAQTLPTATGRIAAELLRISNERGLLPATSLRPLSGTVYAHWTPTDIRQADAAAWATIVNLIREAARAEGGSLVVEDAPWTLSSALDVWGPTPAAFGVMQRMKQQFDPERLLNPGRFVGRL